MELSYILGNGNPEKNSLFFKKGNFFIFQKTETRKKFYYVSGGTSKVPKTKIFYISPKTL